MLGQLSLDLRDQLFALGVVGLGRLTVVQSRVERNRNSRFPATRQGVRAVLEGFLAEQTPAIGARRAAKHNISGRFMAIALPLVA